MRPPTTLLAALLIATALPAGSAELSLEDAVAQALASNRTVTAATARAEAAAARIEQVKAHRLPSVDLTTAYTRTDSPAEVFALQLNQERFDMDEFFMSDPNDPDPLSDWMARLEVTMPVYTGGALSTRRSQSELLAEAARLDLAQARQRAAFDTTSAYVQLTRVREMVALLERSRDTAARHLELAEHSADEGLILAAEVLKARVYVAELDDALARARAGADVARAALNLVMGVPRATDHTLTEVPAGPAAGDALEPWLVSARDRRRDLRAATTRLEAGRLEERVARAAFKPEVAVVGRYEIHDDTAFGTNGDAAAVMAVARINLFRGGADAAAAAAAAADTSSGEADIQHFTAGIELEVEQAWLDITAARARLAAARSAVTAAREALRVRSHRFEQGLERMIDLVDAETSLHEAEVRELSARHDLSLSLFRLHFVAGGSLLPAETSEERAS